MILYGITSVVLLACSGLFVEKYIKDLDLGSSKKAYEDEIPELGIQPQNAKKVQVEIYYETLCPDTRAFLRQEFYPAWQELKHIMDVHWKPYGKATGEDDFQFSCQHGPTECMGNMVHACGVRHVKNEHKLTDYIHCMIDDNYNPKEQGEMCAEVHGVRWPKIEKCVDSKQGGKLLANHGDDTHSMRPKLTFVPTVIMNGRRDSDFIYNFKHKLCSMYRGPKPPECTDVI